jgi:hypothetical protein
VIIFVRDIARHLLLPDRTIVAARELPRAGDREKRTRNHSLPDPLGLPINRERENARRRRQIERLAAKQ